MAEYLARVTWENICAYRKELREGFAGGGSARLPLTDQYGSDQSALSKLKFGDGLWLFTAPVFGQSTLFLSHRHHEAGSLVREVAGHLRDHALCWWDVQELPQSRRYYERCSNKYCGGFKNKIRLLKSVLEGLRKTIWR
jgi:hypothetical protein